MGSFASLVPRSLIIWTVTLLLSQKTFAEDKAFRICSVSGGLDVTRYVSGTTRNFFAGAMEDVELIRESISEGAFNGGLNSGMANLEALSQTLDWEARGLEPGTTTIEAGLGYVDDRKERRVERYVSTYPNDPLVGTKEDDLRLLEPALNILPWLVDRRSVKTDWHLPHQNGQILNFTEEGRSGQAYQAAWVLSWGEITYYYPPLKVFEHPLSLGDAIGPEQNTREAPFVKPNLPENNPSRVAIFSKPYPDIAIPGLSLITAQAPVYYTGMYNGLEYDNTYVASCGVDIAISAVSSYLDVLQDSLAKGSFGILVNEDFNAMVISQHVVNLIYPAYTGNEESRVTYGAEGEIVQDRRNQPYLTSDTIEQSLVDLENANWKGLRDQVLQSSRGQRDLTTLNVTLTGDLFPTHYYVLFERWDFSEDWTLLAFVPVDELDDAMNVTVVTPEGDAVPNGGVGGSIVSETAEPSISLQGTQGDQISGEYTIENKGSMDVYLSAKSIPSYVELGDDIDAGEILLASGRKLPVPFLVNTSPLDIGTLAFAITFRARDADYPDCIYNEDISVQVALDLLGPPCEDSSRVRSLDGECVCDSNTVEIGSGCLSYGGLVGIILAFLFIVLVIIVAYAWSRIRRADNLWKIDPNEIKYDDDPHTLGQGGFGTIVLAEYRGTKVAVKKLDGVGKGSSSKAASSMVNSSYGRTTSQGATTLSSAKLSDFAADMRVLSSLRHPNIITIMGAIVPKRSNPSIVMEFMEMKALSDILHKSSVALDGDSILGILKDITQGVQFLHNTKPQVIHGDLKSHNILIDNMFRAKLTDFGISYNSRLSGTPLWMAPEVLMGHSECTEASDVYSLGIVLYEIYARKEPFQGEDRNDVIKEICDPTISRRPPVPATMPNQISALMHDCLVANPEERPIMDEITSRVGRFTAASVAIGRRLHRGAEEEDEKQFQELLSRFPRHIAEALRDGRQVGPENHECATVVFCGIADFNETASKLPQQKIFDILDAVYMRFDDIAKENGVLKVETTGDSWMGVTNYASNQIDDHVSRVAHFARAAIQSCTDVLIDPHNLELGFVKLIVGFHSGPVLSNVVGSGQYNARYALFGDTVNRAARFLSHKDSKRGVVLCTEESKALLETQAPEMEFSPVRFGERGAFVVADKDARSSATIGRAMAKQKLRILRHQQQDGRVPPSQVLSASFERSNSAPEAAPEASPEAAPESALSPSKRLNVAFADEEPWTDETGDDFKDLEGNDKARFGRTETM